MCVCLHTRCIIPAAVNHTDIKIDTSWAKRIELDVFSTFKYCKISGTVMRRSARRNRRPVCDIYIYWYEIHFQTIHTHMCVCAWRVKHIACIQIDRGTLSEQMLVYIWYIYIYRLCESVFVCKNNEWFFNLKTDLYA